MPWFSSDRTIREYAQDIWNVPVRGTMPQGLQQEPGTQRAGRPAE
jgi:starch phosphorylase